MSLKTPTIAEINQNLIGQLEASLGQTIPILPRSFCRVLAKVLSAVVVLLYKYAGFIFLQLFVAHATLQETSINGKLVSPLKEWGRLIGVGDPTPATRAELRVTVTVQEQIGALKAGSLLLRESTAVIYSVVSAVPLNATTVSAVIQAVDDDQGNLGTGVIGNLEPGDTLSFANPLPYVERAVTVSEVLTTAGDAESEEAYRSRIVKRFRAKPQGGAYSDYQIWGEEVETILNVYPYTGLPGQVDLYAEATVPSSNEDGIPTDDQLQQVFDAVHYDSEGIASRRPITTGVNVYPITRTGLGVEISGLIVDDATSVQGDITEALDEHLRSLEPFNEGLSVLPRKDRALSADIGGLVSDIVRAAGGTFGTHTLLVSGSPITAYTLERGEKARLAGPPVFS